MVIALFSVAYTLLILITLVFVTLYSVYIFIYRISVKFLLYVLLVTDFSSKPKWHIVFYYLHASLVLLVFCIHTSTYILHIFILHLVYFYCSTVDWQTYSAYIFLLSRLYILFLEIFYITLNYIINEVYCFSAIMSNILFIKKPIFIAALFSYEG